MGRKPAQTFEAYKPSPEFDPKIKRGRTVKRAVGYLLHASGPVFPAEIRQATKIPSGSLSPTLARLEEEGIVEFIETDQQWNSTPRYGVQLTQNGLRWAAREIVGDLFDKESDDNVRTPSLALSPDGRNWELRIPGSGVLSYDLSEFSVAAASLNTATQAMIPSLGPAEGDP